MNIYSYLLYIIKNNNNNQKNVIMYYRIYIYNSHMTIGEYIQTISYGNDE